MSAEGVVKQAGRSRAEDAVWYGRRVVWFTCRTGRCWSGHGSGAGAPGRVAEVPAYAAAETGRPSDARGPDGGGEHAGRVIGEMADTVVSKSAEP